MRRLVRSEVVSLRVEVLGMLVEMVGLGKLLGLSFGGGLVEVGGEAEGSLRKRQEWNMGHEMIGENEIGRWPTVPALVPRGR